MKFEQKIGYKKMKTKKPKGKGDQVCVNNFAEKRTLSLKKEKIVFSIAAYWANEMRSSPKAIEVDLEQ